MNSEEIRQYENALESGKESMRWIFITAVIFNLAISISDGTLKYLMFLIRSLQIIIHLPMFRFVIPSNMSMLNDIIYPIIMFDVLENDYDLDANLLMRFNEEAQNNEDILDQMENIGYGKSNCILNLKTLFFVI